MDKNLLWQYIAVGVLIIAAFARMIFMLRKSARKKRGSCCGCSLSETCGDYHRPHQNEARQKSAGQYAPKDCNDSTESRES